MTCNNGTRFRTRNCTNPAPQNKGKNCSSLGAEIEYVVCAMTHCPLDGNYSSWTEFSLCSQTCGRGKKTRKRSCTNPEPLHGGKNCTVYGNTTEFVFCNVQPCPIHGNYSQWSQFTHCSRTCGNGTKVRTRNCTNPVPQYNGNNCSIYGESTQVLWCNSHSCPIHGNFTQWGQFSPCSRSCGNGTKIRLRNCTNPVPRYGGKNCSLYGRNTQIISCNTNPCPIHGNYSQWTDFSHCSQSCGNGTKTRTRNCTNPVPQHGGTNCSIYGISIEIVSCNTHSCPIHGNYTQWTNFTKCSKWCGNGTKSRTRNCTNPTPQHDGRNCSRYGSNIHFLACNTHRCPINGGYTRWSNFSKCSKSCGNGTMQRTRNCTNPPPQFGGRNCTSYGVSVENKICFTLPCPINGGYSIWSKFSPCSKVCGGGVQLRTRNCSNPVPKHGGKDCTVWGHSTEMQVCNRHNCQIDGGFSSWSEFTECTKTCGNGIKTRARNCSNPLPQYGGINCSHLGPALEALQCNTQKCPIDGNYSVWSGWSACSFTCGVGKKQRERTCTNPSPKFGGKNCSSLGETLQEINCNISPCPINGGYSNWSNFTICTKSCNNGTRFRTRVCNDPVPQHGGRNCSGVDKETELCSQHPCPINGNFTEWTKYGPCSRTCGGGVRVRQRFCTKPLPQYGGKNCSWIGPDSDEIPCNKSRPCPGL